MRTIRVFALATLAVFAFASTAQAATIRFAHQDWHRFKSTGKLGQKWDPTMVSKSHRRLTVRIADAGRLLSITFFDHIILGAPAPGRQPYFSFREAGVI